MRPLDVSAFQAILLGAGKTALGSKFGKKQKKSQTPPTTIETICLALNTQAPALGGCLLAAKKNIELKNLFSRQLG